MDPDVALKAARIVAARLIDGDYPAPDCGASLVADGQTLAECFEALDDWLKRDGFLPRDWSGARS